MATLKVKVIFFTRHFLQKDLPFPSKKLSSNISPKAQVRYNCDCTNYLAETAEFSVIHLVRLKLVITAMSSSNLPAHSRSCAPHEAGDNHNVLMTDIFNIFRLELCGNWVLHVLCGYPLNTHFVHEYFISKAIKSL